MSVKITFTGDTPLEALSSLTAFGMRCMQVEEVSVAARRILETERHRQAKTEAAPDTAAPETAQPPSPEPAPAPSPGPAPGENGPTAAPGEAKPGPVPTAEEVRAKGIDASHKYGKQAIVAILKKFNVSGMSALAESDRGPFLEELSKLGDGNA